MGKRFISILLALIMIISLCPVQMVSAEEKGKNETSESGSAVYQSDAEELSDGDTITRGEWVKNLNSLFDFSVEEDNFPDNYFSDLSADSEYYKDVLLAVEFGVIDLEAGEAFHPDEPAAREFAAQTMNNCLRFEREEDGNYSFADVDQTLYPDADQIAVERGWFGLIDGSFHPEMPITTAEAEAIFKDAEAVWRSTDVDTSYDNTFEFAEDVIVVPEGTEILLDENQTVTVIDCPVEIAVGNTFAVYINGLPQAYQAAEVTKDGNNLVIKTDETEQDEVVTDIDAQGEAEGDLSLAQAEGDTEVTYITGGTAEQAFMDGQEFASPRAAGSVPLDAVRFKKTLNFDRGLSVTLNCTLSDLKVKYKINTGNMEAYVGIQGTATVNCSGKFDGMEAVGLPSSLTIGYIPVGGVGSIQVQVDFSMGGQITLSLVEGFSAGVQYKDGFRLVQDFHKKSFSIAAEASVKAGATVSLNVNGIPLVDGSVYASIGAEGAIAANTYDDGQKPETCIHLSAYMYATIGGRLSIDFIIKKFSYSKELAIYTMTNSPVRVMFHYEDNVQVPQCTRGWDVGYFTPWDSKYGSNGRGYGSSTGIGKNGEPYTIYEYTVDEDGNATITGYNGNVTALMIPSVLDGYPVTGIGSRAFSGRNELVTVVVPDSVVTIQSQAFKDCAGLESILLSNNLQNIQGYAFENCVSLESVNLPGSLEVLKEGAFQNCVGLVDVFIPAALQDTGYMGSRAYPGAFNGCANLKSVTFEEGMTRIPNYLFWKCTGLEEVTIPDTITEISSGVFSGCINLKTVNLSKNLEKLGSYAFSDCTSLTSVILPEGLIGLYEGAFQKCTGLTEINIPASLTDTGYMGNNAYPGAFADCSSLDKITFGEGLLEIPSGLFSGCTGLKEITLPDSITKIKWKAFGNCTNLDKINFSQNLKVIDSSAFVGCTALQEVRLPDNLEEMYQGAFQNCTSLSKVYIPASMQNTGYTAANKMYPGVFSGCSSLKEVEFGEGIKTIPQGLFYGCNGPLELEVPEGVTEIKYRALASCSAMKSIKLPETLKVIESQAMSNCSSLENIVLPDSLEKIDGSILSDCTALTSVTLPESMNQIPDSMFANDICLESIELPKTIQTISSSAFSGSGLKSIVMPDSVTKIDKKAFLECKALTDVTLNEGLEQIGAEAFKDCENLKEIEIPDSVNNLGTKIFADCDALSKVDLGTSMTVIPNEMFYQCKSLEQIKLPYGITEIGESAFANCVNFKEITIPQATEKIAASVFSYPAGMTIYGVQGTYAETYASENGIKFENIDIPSKEVSLDPKELSVRVNETKQLTLKVEPSDFTDSVLWKSSNTDVASVDSTGHVTGNKKGTATIKVTVGDKSASCKVQVLQPVTSINLNRTSLTMDALDTFQLTARVNPGTADDQTVSWSSSDEQIASVDQNGIVTAYKKGTAEIKATANDGSGVSKSCEVEVKNNAYVASDVSELESMHNYENNCSDIWIYTLKDAADIDVYFDEQTEVEDGFDYIYIYDKDNNQIGSYTGKELSGQKITISGDTVKIRLVSDEGGAAWGFKVTDVRKKGDTPSELPYTDVDKEDWFYSYVVYVYQKGLMSGFDETTFGPDELLTRGQFASILYRVHGAPEISYSPIFQDVPDGQWFTKAVLWANSVGVAAGYESTGLFGTNDNISREQLVVMMYRYAQYRGYDTSKAADLDKYQDMSSVSGYAVEAMKWATANGIISGKGDGSILDPQGNASRAECATIIVQFVEKYGM